MKFETANNIFKFIMGRLFKEQQLFQKNTKTNLLTDY